jgi:hypothetical protein
MSHLFMSMELKKTNNECLQTIIDNRRTKIKEEKDWRRREVRFREREQHWWAVDRKRLYTDRRAEHLAILAELAAFVAGFQMVMLYELEFPGLDEYWYSSVLLALFGLSCLTVACANICIVFLANLLAIDLFNDSARELQWSFTDDDEMLSPPGCRIPANVAASPIKTAEEMHWLWQQNYEQRVNRILVAFSCSVPVFMLNVGLSTLLKFYMAPAAGWSGWSVAFIGILVWWYCYRYVRYPSVQSFRCRSPAENMAHEVQFGEMSGIQQVSAQSALGWNPGRSPRAAVLF